jgi:hypothetical protein
MKQLFFISLFFLLAQTINADENIYTDKTNGIYVTMKDAKILILDISEVAKSNYPNQKYPLQIGDQIIVSC